MNGYTGNTLHIDLSKKKITIKKLDLSMARNFIGGRGFGIKTVYDNTRKNIGAFHSDNVLVYSTGPLTGTLAPGSSKISICAKSTLGLIGWSHVGGHGGAELKYAGYDLIVVKGKSKNPIFLWIEDDKVEIRNAKHLWGKGTFETADLIREEVDEPNAEILDIGPAGENLVKYGSIVAVGRRRGRTAARCGLGSVMGSKKLKAIAIRGTKDVRVSRPKKFFKTVQKIWDMLQNDPHASIDHPKYGTTSLIEALDSSGALATMNFQKGVFENSNDIGGWAMTNNYLWKGEACFGCTQRCGRYVIIKKGPFAPYAGKGPEFETLAMLGSNLGVKKLEEIIILMKLFDTYGMDTISGGNSIGFAMECYQRGILTKGDVDGLDLSWGNYETISKLTKKIAYREGFGNVLAEGVKKASELIGKGSEKYAMHTKGLEHIGGDPRGQTGFALGYAVCSRGACHLGAVPRFEYGGTPECGLKMFGSKEAANRLGVKGKGRLVKWSEDLKAFLDSMGICHFPYHSVLSTFEKMLNQINLLIELYTFATGVKASREAVWRVGERINNLERVFNVREGVTRKEDSLPERFMKEPLHEGASKGNLVKLEQMLNEYYEARGWEIKKGIPTKSKLEDLGLKYASKELQKLII